MIITQTPLRISFLGGGTDFADFYRREGGCVVSAAIDKYIYVIIKQRFDARIRVGYTRTEMVDSLDEIQHELVRESLRLSGITRQVEVATMGDIPSEGTGLGSSSTVTVGCLNAMYTYLGDPKDPQRLAQDACRIEIETLGKPIGKQDQYIAAYGGLRFIEFGRDGSVQVHRLHQSDSARARLSESLLLFWTGISRSASSVLQEQKDNIGDRMDTLREMKALAVQARSCLEAEAFDELGLLMHRGWEFKKGLASGITTPALDEMYAAARRAGAIGGKITGAGGGGFLLLYAPRPRQDDVRAALRHLRELPMSLEPDGSKVIFNFNGRR
jgi:D-glycero-alpha-D-manno-heptose-7-phosphate kinase